MKAKKIVETTTNRGEFNRAYKRYLENQPNGIRCSYCKYHKGENGNKKWYGGFYDEKKNRYDITHPNWKLVSKNRKQWMKNSTKISERKSTHPFSNRMYVDIVW